MVNLALLAPGGAARSDALPSASLGAAGPYRWRGVVLMTTLAGADVLAVLATGAGATFAVSLAGSNPPASWAADLAGAAALAVCLHLVLGLYRGRYRNAVELFRQRVIAGAILATGMIFAFAPQLPSVGLVLGWSLILVSLVACGCAAAGAARQLLVRFDFWRQPVVLVGEPRATAAFERMLVGVRQPDFRPVAELTPEAAARTFGRAAGRKREAMPAGCALLLSSGDTAEDMRIAGMLCFPTVIVLGEPGPAQTLWTSMCAFGDATGIEVCHPLQVRRNLALKRAFDLAVALPLLALTAPVILLCAAAVWCVDRHNPFYCQSRIGYGGKPFGLLKLRTMYCDAGARLDAHLAANPTAREEWARYFKLTGDPRILPLVGRFLRRTSLDELPQLVNVLRGEMSLIGPRPFPPYHLAGFDAEFRRLRKRVAPGLSGLWQIAERSDGDLTVQRHADTYYIRNWSMWLDLYVLVHTLPAVLAARGAR